jgi:hypothetical protein
MNATSCTHTSTGIPSASLASLSAVSGPHRIIAVRWASGTRQGRDDRVDLSPLIDALRFYAPLRKNPSLFETAHLIDDGYAVAWGDGAIDMSAESIERLAEEAMTRADFCMFLERHSLTHQAAAAVLGRSKRQIENYLQHEYAIPRVVALACYGYEARRESANLASPAVNLSSPPVKPAEPRRHIDDSGTGHVACMNGPITATANKDIKVKSASTKSGRSRVNRKSVRGQ